MLVNFYQSTQCCNPDKSHLQEHYVGKCVHSVIILACMPEFKVFFLNGASDVTVVWVDISIGSMSAAC
jgi:hypothetical protein